jgi:hypothetical protein
MIPAVTRVLGGLPGSSLFTATGPWFFVLAGRAWAPMQILHRFTFINVDRGGFRSLRIGANCFVGHDVLVDLPAPVVLEGHVALAARSVLLTHLTVRYKDHPLMARFPSIIARSCAAVSWGSARRAGGLHDRVGSLHRSVRVG